MASTIAGESLSGTNQAVGFEHERIATPEALAYSIHIWEATSLKQRIEVYSMLGQNIKTAIDVLLKDGLLTGFQENDYARWEVKCKKELHKWRQALQILEQNANEIVVKYKKSRLLQKKLVFEPVFAIDPTEKPERLKIQRHFDVLREARHISSKNISSRQMESYRASPGRCFYRGSSLMHGISINEECQAIANWLLEFGDTVDEWEVGYQDTCWVPAEIAALAQVRRSGWNLDDQNWERFQDQTGAYKVEVLFLSSNKGFPPRYVDLFETAEHPNPKNSQWRILNQEWTSWICKNITTEYLKSPALDQVSILDDVSENEDEVMENANDYSYLQSEDVENEITGMERATATNKGKGKETEVTPMEIDAVDTFPNKASSSSQAPVGNPGNTKASKGERPFFKDYQSPPPMGVSWAKWNAAYRRCNDRRKKRTISERVAARKNGQTRREAIEDLKNKGELEKDYVDTWVLES